MPSHSVFLDSQGYQSEVEGYADEDATIPESGGHGALGVRGLCGGTGVVPARLGDGGPAMRMDLRPGPQDALGPVAGLQRTGCGRPRVLHDPGGRLPVHGHRPHPGYPPVVFLCGGPERRSDRQCRGLPRIRADAPRGRAGPGYGAEPPRLQALDPDLWPGPVLGDDHARRIPGLVESARRYVRARRSSQGGPARLLHCGPTLCSTGGHRVLAGGHGLAAQQPAAVPRAQDHTEPISVERPGRPPGRNPLGALGLSQGPRG